MQRPGLSPAGDEVPSWVELLGCVKVGWQCNRRETRTCAASHHVKPSVAHVGSRVRELDSSPTER